MSSNISFNDPIRPPEDKLNFKQEVVNVAKKIPYARVTTYGTIASLAGWPRGARIVGKILHDFREKLPWHRVINRRGFISIKCDDHPKQLQQALLEQEGIVVSKDFMIDLKKYGWGEKK